MSRTTKKKAIKKSNTVTAYDYTKDIRSYLKSSLFNSYYLEKGYVSKFKDSWIPEGDAWDHFYQGIIEFIETKEASFFLDNKPSESLTVDSYIMPVMALLGWDKFGIYNHYDTETTYDYDGKAYRPDLVYFEDAKNQQKVQALKGKIKSSSGKKKKDYQSQLRTHVEKTHNIIVEAKMFGLLKANSKRKDEVKKDNTRDKTPEGQTVTYMEMLRSERGILTDGGIWKFFHNDFRNEDKYVSFDFGKLALWLIKKIHLEGYEFGDANFKKDENEFTFLLALFYNLFSKEAVLGEKVEHLVEYTKKYSEHLEDKIKNRFVMAVTHACNGLAYAVKKDGKNPDDYLELIKKTAESHLFNIIFFRSLESRGVLPYFGEDNSYDKLSISKSIDSIYENGFSPAQSFKSQLNMFEDYYQERVDSKTTTICDNLIKLYKSVHDGISNGIHIEGFQESVFLKEEWKFAKKYKIPDEYMMNVIFYLNLVPKDRELGEYQLIPYDFLTPRELGSIFESFLEFQIAKAKNPMFWDHKEKQWLENDEVINIRKNEIIKKGEYFFTPDNKELKMTGAFYTPDKIVQYIVEKTLAPLCEGLKPDEILELNVCDPAMGSGHFLKGALDFLTEQYLESHFKHNIKINVTHEEATRLVLHSCIFGVDINPSAVKLAKMSMWLQTASADSELECLEEQLLCGNSLVEKKFQWNKKFKKVFKDQNGFCALVQNPPYVFARDKKIDPVDKKVFENDYEWASYQANTYTLFLERSWDILKTDGRLGAIIPNNWLTINTCESFRLGYLANFTNHVVINSKDKIFDNASVDNSIVFSSKLEEEVESNVAELWELESGKYSKIKDVELIDYDGAPIVMTDNGDFSSDVFEKMEGCRTIGDLFTVKSGLVAYEVGKGKPKQTKEMKDDRIYHSDTKKKGFSPYLQGKDVCRYCIEEPTEYILYGSNLAAPRKKELYEGNRVLVRQIPSKPPYSIDAAFIDNEFINDRNSMIIKVDSVEDAYFVLSILNSKIITNWFIQKFDKFQRKTFPQFKINELKIFPVPYVTSSEKTELITFAKKLSSLYSSGKVEEAKEINDELDKYVAFLFERDQMQLDLAA